MASSASRPLASTPSPSRVTSLRRSSGRTRPSPVTSATSSRVEFVPRSATAMRADRRMGGTLPAMHAHTPADAVYTANRHWYI